MNVNEFIKIITEELGFKEDTEIIGINKIYTRPGCSIFFNDDKITGISGGRIEWTSEGPMTFEGFINYERNHDPYKQAQKEYENEVTQIFEESLE